MRPMPPFSLRSGRVRVPEGIRRGGWRAGLVAVPLAILTVTAFLPVLDNGFVDWDDEWNFLRNPHYRGLARRR